ncbi:hypothetical protein BES34_008310 [Leptospira inadai serovar Lyme]|uniref:Uncharacterized protein n=1 Tax=Leptospira inadai serovar Lyme TaxID=293084 RepID=A0ABX4YK92_9LEPT|nr:hypothetical protein BES34_008310 [Leptospira inadai serovar Lyme]
MEWQFPSEIIFLFEPICPVVFLSMPSEYYSKRPLEILKHSRNDLLLHSKRLRPDSFRAKSVGFPTFLTL